jgi:hypothetical protein
MCKSNGNCRKKLAQIGTVYEITEKLGANNIVNVAALGYVSVMRKDEVMLGDNVVVIKPGTRVPKKAEWASFLKKKVIGTHMYRGFFSDSLMLPFTDFGKDLFEQFMQMEPGRDVTKILGLHEAGSALNNISNSDLF